MSYEVHKPYFDVNEGLARVGGNKALFVKLLGMCVSSPEFERFETAAAAGDIKACEEAVHTVKGLSGNLSMTTLYEASDMFCRSLRDGNFDETLAADYRSAVTETQERLPGLIAELS